MLIYEWEDFQNLGVVDPETEEVSGKYTEGRQLLITRL